MGDSETVVAHSYPPVDYANSNSNPDQEAAVLTNGQDVTNKTVPVGPIEVEGGPTTMEHDSNPSNGVSHTGEKTEGVENSSLDSDLSKLAAFQSSINETEAGEATPDDALAGVVENGTDVHGSAAEPQDGSALTAEEERLWSIIRANSSDFNAWTALIEETEKAGESKVYSTTPWKNHQILATFRYSNHQVNISKIRRVYDAFLAEFPLCYGYWKKYADHEAHLSSIEKVVEVYERAVQGVTYSVEIWTHYCAFATSTYGDPDAIRRLFERGLAYVGTDYLSFQLWDKYIEYEYMQQEWSHLALIYTRILENPNEQLDRYFNSFKELAASRPLSELKAAEESAPAVVNSEAGAQEVKEEADPSVSEGSDKPVSAGSAGLTEAEELEKYVAIREEMYNKAKEFDSKIVSFEKAIRRPYFHVKPLNAVELENWHNYLDFLEGEDDFPKIVKLYERCLVACANYPEFWIRYILCMEAKGSLDLANNALARATQVFVKRQPEIHLFAALLKEEAGDIAGARAAYQLVHTEISPGLLEAIIKHANMEHRLGKLEDAYSVYEQAIAIEKGKEHSQTLSFVFAQYARFLLLVSGNVEKAREVLVQALENIQLSKPLLEALIHLESIQGTHKQIGYIDSLVEKFVVPSSDNSSVASVSEREELSSIFLEFLDLFGDAQSIKKAHVRHAKLFSHHKSTSESRKRSAEDFLVSEKAKQAKSYPGVASSSPSVMGAYPNAQNPWAAYGAQPQAWPQATQPQAQQWNPAYTQQAAAAYGAYGSYGASYPQAPTSVPQPAAAYGAYPQAAYPAQQQQAVAQQSYAQPAVAAVVTPAQQAGPQSYYGTYY